MLSAGSSMLLLIVQVSTEKSSKIRLYIMNGSDNMKQCFAKFGEKEEKDPQICFGSTSGSTRSHATRLPHIVKFEIQNHIFFYFSTNCRI
jgi:hypothetical protein